MAVSGFFYSIMTRKPDKKYTKNGTSFWLFLYPPRN